MNTNHEKVRSSYGVIDYITIDTSNGLIVTLTNYGAAIHRIIWHGRDIAVAPYDIDDFLSSLNYYGKTVGRTAGRIFVPGYEIGDEFYPVKPYGATGSKLHGGPTGFSFRPFELVSLIRNDLDVEVTFRYISNDQEEDYPGEVVLDVTYRISSDHTIMLTHHARTTKDTLLNITNHVYFNLDVPNLIVDHELMIDADKVVDIHPDHRVKGLLDVKGTPYDFRGGKSLGKAINGVYETPFKGFDHTWILNNPELSHPSVVIKEPISGRTVYVHTDYPAVVVYTHNLPTPSHLEMFDGESIYRSLTVECQYEPGGIHHPDLHSAITTSEQTYEHHTLFVIKEEK